MSGYRESKRVLEAKEGDGIYPKRSKLANLSVGPWDLQDLSGSHGGTSSVRIQEDAIQQGELCSGEPSIECPQTPLHIRHNASSHRSFQSLAVRHADAAPKISYSLDEDICFGMLRDIHIRIQPMREKRSISFDEIGKHDIFASLELDINNDRCQILARGTSIATINSKTHLALKSLSVAESLRWTGIVRKSDLHEKLAAAAKSLDSSRYTCTISILVFGPRSVAETLAKEFSRYRLFLQHPQPMPTHVVYENPQYLSMVASSFANGALLPSISAEAYQQSTNSPDEIDQDEMVDLQDVIDNLPKQDYLREADVDSSIQTQLLSHQREAVDFVICRETVQYDKSKKLWRIDSSNPAAPIYRHIITGSRSSEPADMLGGILADGMGLGKTLSMIASIVARIPPVEELPMESLLNDRGNSTSLIPVTSTLVIVPSVQLINGWIKEIEKHVMPQTLTFYIYHGPARSISLSSPLPYNIVFSTYHTVAADFSRGGGVLNRFHWHRLILDEAHSVRNISTKQFKAIYSLSASIRWCMTGTPVQNSLDDLAALITFLRVPLLEDAVTFRKHIAGRSKMTGGLPTPDYGNLKLLLGAICLRRKTSSVLTSLGITVIKHRPCFSETERRAYDELAISCSESIKAAVHEPPTKGGNKSILTAMLRLRIFCNTGLASPMTETTEDLEEQLGPHGVETLSQRTAITACSECDSEASSCDTCHSCSLRKHGSSHRALESQGCAKPDSGMNDVGSYPQDAPNLMNSDADYVMLDAPTESQDGSCPTDNTLTCGVYPSKLIALLEDIKKHYLEDKSIIFSFWTRSLDLVGKLLHEEGVLFSRMDGSVEQSQRESPLMEFQKNPSVRVLLMTINTGSVGLNDLSVASRVHILEPQWNPAAEDQAIGRAFRLGQDKNVCIIRYIMQKTIEESIESRQLSKVELLLKGGLQSLEQGLSGSKSRIADLQNLGSIIESTILSRSVC